MRRVLVANRGEIAVRVIRACRELGLESVAVYSDADAEALHVRMADAAVRIGGPQARDSYLNGDAIVAAALEAKAEAVHPGYGFLSENARFAAACERAGITFVGPRSEAIAQMGDKARARELARAAGVPVVPGSESLVTPEEAVGIAADIGYPVMVKAAAGGGGRGIRAARDENELREVVAHAAREARGAFGDDSLYLEKLIIGARHVEVQVLGDTHGNLVHLYERDCSLQRRRQKIIEEAPSPALHFAQRHELAASALRLARAVDYCSAGTMEFLLDLEGRFYFIEMNTRIQVEHPVTELVTGVDIVHEQLRVAAGEPLSIRQEDVALNGHALEFRINAEDPERDFMPSPGTISAFRVPKRAGVRVDTACFEGCAIPPFYDSLIAKLVVWGETREQALELARVALSELEIEGVKTTIPLHRELLTEPDVRSGDVHIGFLEQLLATSAV